MTLEELNQVASQGGPASALVQELLVIHEQYQTQQLTKEEFDFLVQQIAEVRAAQELANDEIAWRYVVAAAQGISALI
jgi:uncharacterized coiled-coil DUF342 family protein